LSGAEGGVFGGGDETTGEIDKSGFALVGVEGGEGGEVLEGGPEGGAGTAAEIEEGGGVKVGWEEGESGSESAV
jgi:hypothetical protein